MAVLGAEHEAQELRARLNEMGALSQELIKINDLYWAFIDAKGLSEEMERFKVAQTFKRSARNLHPDAQYQKN